ncbi:MAG: Fe-S oxidoreductase, partial [bacterium]|nr:Fe-S oxidoreductase [bacterium]
GFRSAQLLKIAGAEVEMIESCSGVDGTWGMKSRWYDQSLKIATKLLDEVRRVEPDHVATDCPLAALRIQEGTGRRAVHPIVLIRDAYGLGAGAGAGA